MIPGPPMTRARSPASSRRAAAIAELKTSSGSVGIPRRGELGDVVGTLRVGVVCQQNDAGPRGPQSGHGLGRAGNRLICQPNDAVAIKKPGHPQILAEQLGRRVLGKGDGPPRSFPGNPLRHCPRRPRRRHCPAL